MKLDLLNNILNGIKGKEATKSLKNEIDNYLENDETPIIERLVSENKMTTGNENYIRDGFDDLILKYAKQNFENSTIYFVLDNKKTYWLHNQKHYDENVYTVLKVENNKMENIEIPKTDMPNNIGTNSIFKIENEKYILQENDTKQLQKEITDMVKKTVDRQNASLTNLRQNGHLYIVTEEIGNNRFLLDFTEKSKTEFEEVEIPEDVLDKATEGTVLLYNNGKYEYYSDEGYEMLEEINKK